MARFKTPEEVMAYAKEHGFIIWEDDIAFHNGVLEIDCEPATQFFGIGEV